MNRLGELLLYAVFLCPLLAGCQSTQTVAGPTPRPAAFNEVSKPACKGMDIKIITHGDEIEIDGESLPVNMREGYALFKVHCTKCHLQNRTIGYLQDCQIINSENYESNLKVTILKKIRLRGGDLSKPDATKIYDFLLALYRIAAINSK